MNWLKKNIWLLASLAIAVLAGRMLLTSHHFYVHDDIQVFRVSEFVECIRSRQIPCRWSANLGKGYGMPWFNYYPPMIYAIPSAISLLGFSYITSLNLLMFLSFILAAWGMYLLIYTLTNRADLGFLGSILYTLYPFHATNVFLRGVYAENLAWSLAPWILYFIYTQFATGKFQKSLPLLFAAVFLTHIISSFLIVGMSIIWVLLLDYKKLLGLAKSMVIGLGISAFFFVPAMLEKNLVQSSSLIEGYYSYLNHFLTIKQLFLSYTWNYGASYWGTPDVEMGYMVGHVHTILLAVVLLFSLYFRPKSRYHLLALGSLLSFAFVLFLTHNKSAPIYQLLPSLSYVQFPWRFVAWAAIPLVVCTTLYLSTLPHKLSQIIIYLAIPTLIIYSYPFFFPRGYDNYVDSDYLTGQFKKEQQTKALFDYLPLTVQKIPDVEKGIFYFPGWTAKETIAVDPVTGLIIGHPAGLAWRETPLRLLSDWVSILTLSGYLIFLMYNNAYGKRR